MRFNTTIMVNGCGARFTKHYNPNIIACKFHIKMGPNVLSHGWPITRNHIVYQNSLGSTYHSILMSTKNVRLLASPHHWRLTLIPCDLNSFPDLSHLICRSKEAPMNFDTNYPAVSIGKDRVPKLLFGAVYINVERIVLDIFLASFRVDSTQLLLGHGTYGYKN